MGQVDTEKVAIKLEMGGSAKYCCQNMNAHLP